MGSGVSGVLAVIVIQNQWLMPMFLSPEGASHILGHFHDLPRSRLSARSALDGPHWGPAPLIVEAEDCRHHVSACGSF